MIRRLFGPGRFALGVAATALLLAACGAGADGTPSGSTGAGPSPVSVTKDQALAKMVPADVAADGKIVVGTDASYAPNEFAGADGQTIIGMDVDLGKAIAQKLGLTAEFHNSAFGGILPGLQAGKYEWGMSSFTINPDRIRTVDMVSYFTAGTRAAVARGNPEHVSLDNLCGKAVGVQNGTVQFDDLSARNQKCQTEGKPPIAVISLQAQTDVTLALSAKRVVAMLADGPVINYAIAQSDGGLEALGGQYDTAPYGIAIAKNRGEFARAVRSAVQALIDDGTYTKIINKWGGAEGGIKSSQINPASG